MSVIEEFLTLVRPEEFTDQGFKRLADPQDCFVLLHVHVLPSLTPLIRRLLELGFKRERILLVGKAYSIVENAADEISALGVTVLFNRRSDMLLGHYDNAATRILEHACQIALERLDRNPAARVLLVDDGGLLTEAWFRRAWARPYGVVSIQQTASGFGQRRRPEISPYVKISVARSAAKSHFESVIIAHSVVRAASAYTSLKGVGRVGILGVGRLGSALARRLARKWRVNTYDRRDRQVRLPNVRHYSSALEAIAESDVIFGCTGNNVLTKEQVSAIRFHKQFVSCSSRDVEFATLLRDCHIVDRGDGVFGTIKVAPQRGRNVFVEVANGGFPINFDRKIEWEQPEEIALTRGLILGAIVQALYLPATTGLDRARVCRLDSTLQRRLVRHWLMRVDRYADHFDRFSHAIYGLDWWRRESEGEDMSAIIEGGDHWPEPPQEGAIAPA